MQPFMTDLQATLGPIWPLLAFLLILLVGYIVAKVAEALTRRGLRKVTFDDKLLASVTDGPPRFSSEHIGGRIVFWIVLVLATIVAFDAVNLRAVSGPLGTFADRTIGFIPNLIAGALLALIAYVVATVLRMLTTKGLQAADLDGRLDRVGRSDAQQTADAQIAADAPATKVSLADTLGQVVFYLVLLLFLPAILDALQLSGILAPVQGLVNEVLGFLPNLALAAIIVIVGAFVARILRNIVTNLLAAAGADRLSERVGLSRATGGTSLASLIGLVVYILVLIPVIVAALNALQVEAVTRPASAMLDQFLLAIPRVFVAALILAIAFVVGRLIASLVTSLLAGVGFNRLFEGLGFRTTEPVAAAPTADTTSPTALDMKSPAGIVGWIVLVAVMLFAATEAANALGLEAVALLVVEFTVLAGRVLLGLLIFGVGLYLANLAYTAVRSSGTSQAHTLAVAARVSILVLAAAMALRQMGLADSIINLAFGLVLGAIALAAAIAFGWGGRDVAREQLEKLRDRVEADDAPTILKPDADAPGAPAGPGASPAV